MTNRGKIWTITALALLWCLVSSAWAAPVEFSDPPKVTLRGVPFELEIKNTSHVPQKVFWSEGVLQSETSGGIEIPAETSKKLEFLPPASGGEWTLSIWTEEVPDQKVSTGCRVIPGWLSLLPPLIAIGLALATRQVLVSLLCGILGGAWLIHASLFSAGARTLDFYLIHSLAQENGATDHAFILIFTMALGGMVALVSASGGMQGMVDLMKRYAKGPVGTQVATWAMGVAIFFDDYANTLLVGQTMRPATDEQKISREKLAYLVDSTAAPIASIALISTWIGYEMSLIQDSFSELGINKNVYIVFLESILHRYYAILTLVFVLAIAWFHRDFGPMLKAERRALSGQLSSGEEPEELEKPEATWGRSAWDAFWPVSVVLFGTIAGLVLTGLDSLGSFPTEGNLVRRVGTLIAEGNSFKALLWAAVGGGVVAALISKLRYRISLEKITDVYMKGVTHMVASCIVLILAWAIGDVCGDLGTGPYLVETCRDLLSPRLMPVITFLLSAVVAFSTGTSWGTMAIVMPLAIRLAHTLPAETGLPEEAASTILIATIAGVLAGATFGDHCSPISDTTIMSSMASGCNHVDHVRTQIPYATTTAGLSVIFGAWPAAYGVNPWLLNILGCAACIAVVRYVGKPVIVDPLGDAETEAEDA